MLRAFWIKRQTTASTSLHVYFMISDSCTVFLHLYKSIFLLLPSRSSEQCSLWLLGSIKVCQMNRKNHAWRGNEKLSKATWNLKHFFSSFLFSLIWRLALALNKLKGFAQWVNNTCVLFVACLTCFLVRNGDCQQSKTQHSLERECWMKRVWLCSWHFKSVKPVPVLGFVNKLEVIVHSDALMPERKVIWSFFSFSFKRHFKNIEGQVYFANFALAEIKIPFLCHIILTKMFHLSSPLCLKI